MVSGGSAGIRVRESIRLTAKAMGEDDPRLHPGQGDQQVDLNFVDKLGEWQVPFCLVFTKSDKETQKVVSQHVKEFLQAMRKHWDELPDYFVTSAEKGLGRDKLLERLDGLNKAYMTDNP